MMGLLLIIIPICIDWGGYDIKESSPLITRFINSLFGVSFSFKLEFVEMMSHNISVNAFVTSTFTQFTISTFPYIPDGS